MSHPRSPCRAQPAALVVLLAGLAAAVPSRAQNVDESWWGANGPVMDFLEIGSTLYVAGLFSWVGPNTGGGVPVDPGTGQRVSGFPEVRRSDAAGIVLDAASDGNGGWYIVGRFDTVGGVPRDYAAHILADLSVGAWDPDPDSTVITMSLQGSEIYLGGLFTQVGGTPRTGLAAVDAVTGVATSWNPGCDGGVEDLEFHGNTVFVGGLFGNCGGQPRSNLAQIDLTTGLATAWNPGADDIVFDVEVLSPGGTPRVYAGGGFNNMGALTRNYLAEIDIATGMPTAFDANPNSVVNVIVGADSLLYVGGSFTTIGGLPRQYIAQLDPALGGEATSFVCDADASVIGLHLDGGLLYAGGYFRTLCGTPRNCAGRVVLSSGGVDGWDPDSDFGVGTFAPGVTGEVYVGGGFLGINGKTRNGLAAFDVSTRQLLPWDPAPDDRVNALATDGSQLLVGGRFTTIGGVARQRLASFDASTTALTAWNPGADSVVHVIEVEGSSVYVGGEFANVAGLSRPRIARFDAGALSAWNPAADAAVRDIVVAPAGVYVGGRFSQIGGQPRNNLACLGVATGVPTPWNPNPDAEVRGIEPVGATVFVRGSFSTIGGGSRRTVAEVDATTGLATSWDAAIPGGMVSALEVSSGKLWMGGNFSIVQGQPAQALAVIDLQSRNLLPWSAVPDQWVHAIFDDGTNVFLGGDFGSVGGSMAAGMARTDGSPVGAPWASSLRGQPGIGAWPNPMRDAGALHFELRRAGEVRLDLFDVRGRRVRTLLDGARLPAGRHAVPLTAADLTPGVYFARWEGAGERAAAKLTVIR